MRVPMIATKAMTYATRQLRAEEPFEANRSEARLLVALGRARLVEAQAEPSEHGIKALREEYLKVIGKRPFNAWDEPTLREKIAAAKNED